MLTVMEPGYGYKMSVSIKRVHKDIFITFTHFQLESGIRICNAATGCLNSSVKDPKSL